MRYQGYCLVLVVGLAGIGFFGSGVDCLHAFGTENAPFMGKGIESFKLPDLEGRMRDVADYKGKVVLINLFTTYCGPCLEEMPHLVELHRDYPAEEFAVLAISRDEKEPEKVKRLAEAYQIPFPVLLDTERKATEQFADENGLVSLPTSILLDRDQRIIAVERGFDVSKFKRLTETAERAMEGGIQNKTAKKENTAGESEETKLLTFTDQEGKDGYMNRQGEVVIPPRFKNSHEFSEGLAAATLDGKQWGYINRAGKFVIEPRYRAAGPFCEGRARILPNGENSGETKWGYIDPAGKVVADARFLRAHEFKEGLARVCVKVGRWGFIDRNGTFVIEPRFSHAYDFDKGLARAEIGDQWGFIDRTGQFAIAPRFDRVSRFREGLAPAQEDFLWGFVNRNGFFEIERRFHGAHGFSEGLAAVKSGTKWGFIDKTGKFVIEPRFTAEICRHFSEGLLVINVNGKWGYLDRSGKIAIEPQFANRPGDFREGLARVNMGGTGGFAVWRKPSPELRERVKKMKFEPKKIGYIDRSGEFVIDPQFERGGDFSGGLARVKIGKARFYIDKSGKKLPPGIPLHKTTKEGFESK